ncbi:hypothetical protein [Rhizobium sp. 18065]|uniref:hypothetical protein n=1 Tax=Rhizobium sp. 18065 TaxID=2681411 RepID=UPI00135A61C4|nr:hypothetical protein [Rhizobium sp. 18065]
MIISSPAAFVRKAKLEDIPELASRLRHEDVREIRSTTPAEQSLESVLAYNVGASSTAFAIVDLQSDAVIALFGAAPAGDGTGSVWMHGSDLIKTRRITFLKHSRRAVELLHAEYPILRNWADTRNQVHLDWLRYAGFRFLGTSTSISNDGTPFVEFFRKGR